MASHSTFQLYGAQTGNCFRAAIALEEAGLPYTPVLLDLAKGEHGAEAHLQLNPSGKVPTVVEWRDGEKQMVLSQSNAIILYVASENGRLLPWQPECCAREYGFSRFTTADNVLKLLGDDGVPTREAIAQAGSDPNLSPMSPFTKRDPDAGIHYVGSYQVGTMLDRTVRTGDSVNLRIGKGRVLIDNVVVLANGRYSGEIRAFDTIGTEEVAGLHEWDTVEFELADVHGCHHR